MIDPQAFSPAEFVAQASAKSAVEPPASTTPDAQGADGDARRELKALGAMVSQLEQMDRTARARMLTYLNSRFG